MGLESDGFAYVDTFGDDDASVSPATNRRLWLGFVVVAFLIFELTANPPLAVAFGCFKFGWKDFVRANRLKYDDPSPVRGKVCARFTTAWGLIKVCLVAIALMAAIVGFQMYPGRGKPAPVPAVRPPVTFVTAGLLTMAGLGVSSLVSSFAVASALRHGLRVWVGGRVNRAKLVLAVAILTWVTVGFFAMLLVTVIPSLRVIAIRSDPLWVLLALAFGYGIPIHVLVQFLERRVVARSPAECWDILPAHLVGKTRTDDWEDDPLRRRDLETFGRTP